MTLGAPPRILGLVSASAVRSPEGVDVTASCCETDDVTIQVAQELHAWVELECVNDNEDDVPKVAFPNPDQSPSPCATPNPVLAFKVAGSAKRRFLVFLTIYI